MCLHFVTCALAIIVFQTNCLLSGLIIYYSYGMTHSKERQRDKSDYSQLESTKEKKTKD